MLAAQYGLDTVLSDPDQRIRVDWAGNAGIRTWVIDADMVRNAFQTTPAEAGHLITTGFLVHMLLFAALPIGLVFWLYILGELFFGKMDEAVRASPSERGQRRADP